MPPAERDRALDRLKGEVAGYYERFLRPAAFIPGETPVPVSGKVWDADELQALVEASLDGWWTEGRFTQAVQLELGRFVGARNVVLCNSGSSSNLLAFTALTSKLLGERRIPPGSEVITVAAGFPTTIAPIVQNRCVPVMVDIELGTYNIDVARIGYPTLALEPAFDGALAKTTLLLGGMTCAACVRRVEAALSGIPGVREAAVNLATSKATVTHVAHRIDASTLKKVIEDAGYEFLGLESAAPDDPVEAARTRELRELRIKLLAGGVLTTLVMVISMPHWFPFLHRISPQHQRMILFLLTTPVVFWVGDRFISGAVKALRAVFFWVMFRERESGEKERERGR